MAKPAVQATSEENWPGLAEEVLNIPRCSACGGGVREGHTYAEVFRWLESWGLQDSHVGRIPISVYGRKPEMRRELRASEYLSEVPSCAG